MMLRERCEVRLERQVIHAWSAVNDDDRRSVRGRVAVPDADAFTRVDLQDHLLNLWNEFKPTLVMVTHDARAAAYADRVLFLADGRVVSGVGEQELHTDFEEAFRYLEQHTEVRDVLLSGGDALIFSDDKIDKLLSRLRAIKHIEFIRIGTRVPIFLPQRITPELCAILAKYHPLWMSVHVNHPRELTIEVKEALERLANAGIPLGNQSVLLKGVNDDLETMKMLVHKLLMCRVRPYYLYQCDLINGSSHLRASVAKGIEIIEGLRGHTTGYGVPQFVIDAPGGGGKVPINPGYVLYHDNEKIVIRNYEGKIFEYPETGNENVQFAPQREYHDEYLYS